MKLPPAPTPELEALRRERIARFRVGLQAWKACGHFDVVIRHNGRRYLIEQLAREARHAVWPDSGYYHPSRPIMGRNLPGPKIGGEDYHASSAEVDAWVQVDPFTREGLTRSVAADLAWLERQFSGRRPRS